MAKKQELTRDQINQYIWKRYIDNTSNYTVLSESDALKFFERYYSKHPINEDDECFFFGVLCFELAFQTADETKQARLLGKAKEVLQIYRQTSGEEDWDAIEDRLEECNDFLAEKDSSEVNKPKPPNIPKAVDGMILINSGKFLFGADKQKKFLEAFYIDVNPVTNSDYRKFVVSESYRNPRIWAEKPEFAAEDLPVTGVSWMDALQYCKWAHKELPSEEQWEKAARGTGGKTYPWGDNPPTPQLANFSQGKGAKLQAPKKFAHNISEFGCRATVGHVWEWTSTIFDKESRHRVVKGGSWADPIKSGSKQYLTAHSRQWAGVKEKSDLIGFRCVRPVKSL